jgi:hypothetical protein
VPARPQAEPGDHALSIHARVAFATLLQFGDARNSCGTSLTIARPRRARTGPYLKIFFRWRWNKTHLEVEMATPGVKRINARTGRRNARAAQITGSGDGTRDAGLRCNRAAILRTP